MVATLPVTTPLEAGRGATLRARRWWNVRNLASRLPAHEARPVGIDPALRVRTSFRPEMLTSTISPSAGDCNEGRPGNMRPDASRCHLCASVTHGRGGSSIPVMTPPPHRLARIGFLLFLALYAVLRLTNAEHWDLLDDVNLAIHEAGHVFFQPFGDQITALGGSLFQCLVPLAFVIYFARTRQRYAAGVTMAWVAVNLVNVSRYIADARAQELPLLGGENVIHDWWYLLIENDLLKQDTAIARWVHFAGAVAFVGALAWAWMGVAGPPARVEGRAASLPGGRGPRGSRGNVEATSETRRESSD